MSDKEPVFLIRDLVFYYGSFKALKNINMDVLPREVTALIGPSGCGKSTFLRCLNRMNDRIEGTRIEGQILLDGQDIYAPGLDQVELRHKVGMVFQRPNPFPQSIYNNVAFGPRILGLTKSKDELRQIVEQSLSRVGLWQEVKDILKENALSLSLGQQQRLCLARVIAVEPQVILMDEPASALDPIATQTLEDLIEELKREYTIIIVTHSMEQAARVSNKTGFFWLGELIEFAPTDIIFTRPEKELTENYITGRMG